VIISREEPPRRYRSPLRTTHRELRRRGKESPQGRGPYTDKLECLRARDRYAFAQPDS